MNSTECLGEQCHFDGGPWNSRSELSAIKETSLILCSLLSL